jgi:hypothetical protein
MLGVFLHIDISIKYFGGLPRETQRDRAIRSKLPGLPTRGVHPERSRGRLSTTIPGPRNLEAFYSLDDWNV